MMQTTPSSIPPDFIAFTERLFEAEGIPADDDMILEVAEKVYAKHQPQKKLWQPINDLQRLALESQAFEIYCGGRARTGKTDLILGAALTQHKNSIIFRTEYKQIKALSGRSRDILRGTGASYNGNDHEWKGIPGDRTLEFGALKYDADVDKFYGRPHDGLFFDEIPKFKEEHYLTVFAWACSADPENNPDQRVRIICTGNPPTRPSELWVKQRWGCWVDERHPNPAAPGEIRWFVNVDGRDTEVESQFAEVADSTGKILKPISRTFLPGELLHFYRGTEYEAFLDALPEVQRRALRDGDFTVAEDDQARQVIKTEHVRLAFERWEQMKKPDTLLRGLGVDVARGGRDQTIISKRYGNWFAPLLKYAASETPTGTEVANLVELAMPGDERKATVVIDLTGVGASPYDLLISRGFNVDGFMGASKSSYVDSGGTQSFANRRAEAWWNFREALDPNSPRFQELALPPDSELMADLTAPTFEIDTRGYLIESKDAIIKRLGRSPDCGDAVVMNFNIDLRYAENMSYF